MSLQKKTKGTATAWDPSSPVSILIAPNKRSLNVMLASDGLGCNREEISALLELLDARDELEEQFDDFIFRMDDHMKSTNLFHLSTKYIQNIHQCVTDWTDRVSTTDDSEINPETETQNLSYLMQMHSILHLSSIYLLSPYFSIADTVRFLRHHFIPNPLDNFSIDSKTTSTKKEKELDAMEEMLASPQPEYYQSGTPYWTLIERLIKRGMLKDAWAILSNHSVCRSCSKDTPSTEEEEEEMEQARRGFSQLYAFLNSAPIPGGQSAENDMDFHNNNLHVIEDDIDNNMLLDGVPTTSFQYWESEETFPAAYSHWMTWNAAILSALAHGIEGGLHRRIPQLMTSVLAVLAGQLPDHPQCFESPTQDIWAEILLQEILYLRPNMTASDVCTRANAAMRNVKIKNNENPSARSGLETCVLSIMRGDAGTAISATHIIGGGSGAALPSTMCALLCDLLTHANLLFPLGSSHSDMNPVNHHVELLLSAASACQSSFATSPTTTLEQKQQYKQIGIQCAVRLLRYTHQVRGVATISQITSSLDQSMASDREISALLKLCDYKFITTGDDGEENCNRGQEMLFLQDAYVDICLSRANYHLRSSRPGGAAYWCLKCIEFELKSFANTSIRNRRGAQLLDQICHKATIQLIKAVSLIFDCYTEKEILVEEEISADLAQSEVMSPCLIYAKEVLNTIENENTQKDINITLVLQHLSDDELVSNSLRLLTNSLKLCDGFLEGNNMKSALAIIECLKESEGGSGETAACIGTWPKFLSLAYVVLARQEENLKEDIDRTSLSGVLEVEHVRVLMGSLATLAMARKNFEENMSNYFSLNHMRFLLGKALMYAFEAENQEKKKLIEKRERQNMGVTEGNIEETVARLLSVPPCSF